MPSMPSGVTRPGNICAKWHEPRSASTFTTMLPSFIVILMGLDPTFYHWVLEDNNETDKIH
jgi:hypothetical protein